MCSPLAVSCCHTWIFKKGEGRGEVYSLACLFAGWVICLVLSWVDEVDCFFIHLFIHCTSFTCLYIYIYPSPAYTDPTSSIE